MNNRETACFAICATTDCTIFGLDGLNAEAMQLTASINRNFGGLGL